MSTKFYTLEVSELIPEGSKALSIVFNVPEQLSETFKYHAGQYLTLMANIDGTEVRRAYSLSSSPNDGKKLKVSVKKVENGLMSSYLCEKLKSGDEIQVMAPMGNFLLDENCENLNLFAAGSGITPLISILKSALHTSIKNINLIFSNRSEQEAMFLAEIKTLEAAHEKLKVLYLFSDQGSRLDVDTTKKIVENHELKADSSLFYICGPSGMITSVHQALSDISIPESKIKIEYFASPKTEEVKTDVVVSGEVNEISLIMDGQTHQVALKNQETILEAGERIGIDPPFSCQSGVCTTCMAKVIQGEVHMENNFGLAQEEIDEGYVLTCIGTPKTPGVVVSWDE